jgi:hypothetical protein
MRFLQAQSRSDIKSVLMSWRRVFLSARSEPVFPQIRTISPHHPIPSGLNLASDYISPTRKEARIGLRFKITPI